MSFIFHFLKLNLSPHFLLFFSVFWVFLRAPDPEDAIAELISKLKALPWQIAAVMAGEIFMCKNRLEFRNVDGKLVLEEHIFVKPLDA